MKLRDHLYPVISILAVLRYGPRKITWNGILGLGAIILGVMIVISAFSPDNPVRFVCASAGIFSLWFGNWLLLQNDKSR